jgi:hypothetical protein
VSTQMRFATFATLIGVLVAADACGTQASESARRDALTRRQRDSAIGASALPGARGVQGALAASDTAERRGALLDSIANAP